MIETKKSGFDGSVEGVTLVDLVQLACIEGEDRKLSVQHENDSGTLYFSENEIVHAVSGEITGENAFYEIMRWPSGHFSMTFAGTDTRSIDSSWNFLLMEAVRRIDEQEGVEGEDSDTFNVLVVDDSRLFTKAFVKLFDDELGAKVVGTATNGKEALKFLEVQIPDLVTLDINMPVMGGDVALKHIMIRSPAPVVLVSNFNEQSCTKLMDFMRLGAVDVVAKPVNPQSWKIVSQRLEYILTNVKELHLSNVSRAKHLKPVLPENKDTPQESAARMVLILSGLGGMLELQKIIPSLQYNDETAVLVLQNMYPAITEHLAQYLDNFTAYTTKTVSHGMEIMGGDCWVGNCHGQWELDAKEGVPTLIGFQDENNEVQLNTDRLLESTAEQFGSSLSVVILSGVEMDLKKGLELAAAKGAEIILQNPDSCLLPGPINALGLLLEGCKILKPEEIGAVL